MSVASAEAGTVPDEPRPLGIIAGGGAMPSRVARAAQGSGRPVFLVGLEGHADAAALDGFPHAFSRVGAASRIRSLLEQHNCRDIVLVGRVRRPSILELRPDVEMARLWARLGRATFAGDDGFLGAIVRVLGEEGFRVLGAHEVFAEALGPAGLLTGAAPDAQAMADIARGVAVARALGTADVGQCCVVQLGIVLAVEAAEGTDAMLARCGALARPGVGGVLVKLVKPGQDRRADLPTIGAATVAAASAAGLRGIAYEAGGTILVDRADAIAAADRAGLFLLGLDADNAARVQP